MRTDVLSVACEAAIEGAKILSRLFILPEEKLHVQYKQKDADTPVSMIDREVGRVIIPLIGTRRPSDTIYSEELGLSGIEGAEYVWWVDELDGTINVRPKFRESVVMASVSRHGELIATAVAHPFERTLTFGERGGGAFTQTLGADLDPDGSEPKRLCVSNGRSVKERIALIDTFYNEKNAERKLGFQLFLSRFIRQQQGVSSHGVYWTRLAQGRVDMAVTDFIGGYWDTAPGIVLVPEAGGRITDLEGNTPRPEQYHVALGTNGENHDEFLHELKRLYEGYTGPR